MLGGSNQKALDYTFDLNFAPGVRFIRRACKDTSELERVKNLFKGRVRGESDGARPFEVLLQKLMCAELSHAGYLQTGAYSHKRSLIVRL